MRFLRTTIALSLALLSGCSHVEPYRLDATQESAASSYQSAKILNNNKVDAVISALYLNDVYPHYSHKGAYFLVSIYTKEPSAIFFLSGAPYRGDNTYVLKRNSDSAISVTELEEDDLLIDLMPIGTRWAKYYYVTYPYKEGSPRLILTANDGRKAILSFKKPNINVMLNGNTVGKVGRQ